MMKPIDLDRAYRLLNIGATTLVSAAHEGDADIISAACTARPDAVQGHSRHRQEPLHPQAHRKKRFFRSDDSNGSHRSDRHESGTVSKNDNPRKLEECGTRLVTLPEYDMPLLEGCAARIVFRVVPELHNQEAYDLFIGEAVAAFADDRVFVNGRWNFEEAPDDLRTLHYVAGGHFYTIGDALEVPASA